jgi:transposase
MLEYVYLFDYNITTMYIDTSKIRNKSGKTYTRHLLRRCYRENGKIKHETVANLSHCAEAEINAMKLALKHKEDLTQLCCDKTQVLSKKSKSIGAVWLLWLVAKRLGIPKALDNSEQGKLALWQIFSRIIEQGSRLSSVRLATRHTHEILELQPFSEDDLYSNLDWLADNQAAIEDSLFEMLGKRAQLFLYDVTSSYFEGICNELSAFGYNRDGKKGKLQIVIGLLCNEDGVPISVEVFEGNTRDHKTLPEQIKKAAQRFGVEKVTFVGDRGMIKSAQIKELDEQNFHYITAITKPQIQTLLSNDAIQLSLFDNELTEVIYEDIRYVLRRNPVREAEIQKTRQEKFDALQRLVANKNEYLKTHKRAKVQTVLNAATKYAAKLKITKWVEFIANKAALTVVRNEEVLKQESMLDGCYVIKTDLSQEVATKELVHNCYKDLALVEQAFRSSKTVQLDLRPIYVRLASRTRGHVFVVMLAYRIIQELAKCWKQLDVTVDEGVAALSELCQIEILVDGKVFNQIPEPDELAKKLLALAKVTLPTILPKVTDNVTTKVKLTTRRKTL